MIGVFAATDVFLFYVFFEAMLIPMYFMIGSYGVGQRQYAAVKFLLYSLLGGLLMLVAVIALYVYSARGGHPGTFLFSQLTHAHAQPGNAALAVPRLLRRVRHQGTAVAVPHLAARCRHGRAAGRGRAARRRAGQGRHVRHDPLLPGAVPLRVALLHAAGHHARGDRGPVRRDRGDRPGGPETADRLHLGLPLRPDRARHLRDDQPGPDRRHALHGEPRVRHRRAVPDRRIHDRAAPVAADRRLRRRAEGRAGAGGPVPDRRPGRAGAARPVHVRQRVPRPGRHVHPVRGGSRAGHRRHHPRRDLHPVDVPAHDDRAGRARRSPACRT